MTHDEIRKEIEKAIRLGEYTVAYRRVEESVDQVMQLFAKHEEELADSIPTTLFQQWRAEVEEAYAKKKPAVLISFPMWLREYILKNKEGEYFSHKKGCKWKDDSKHIHIVPRDCYIPKEGETT